MLNKMTTAALAAFVEMEQLSSMTRNKRLRSSPIFPTLVISAVTYLQATDTNFQCSPSVSRWKEVISEIGLSSLLTMESTTK